MSSHLSQDHAYLDLSALLYSPISSLLPATASVSINDRWGYGGSGDWHTGGFIEVYVHYGHPTRQACMAGSNDGSERAVRLRFPYRSTQERLCAAHDARRVARDIASAHALAVCDHLGHISTVGSSAVEAL